MGHKLFEKSTVSYLKDYGIERDWPKSNNRRTNAQQGASSQRLTRPSLIL